MGVKLQISTALSVVAMLASSAADANVKWSGAGYYIEDPANLFDGYIAGPFSKEAKCKAALAARGGAACAYHEKTSWSGAGQYLEGKVEHNGKMVPLLITGRYSSEADCKAVVAALPQWADRNDYECDYEATDPDAGGK